MGVSASPSEPPTPASAPAHACPAPTTSPSLHLHHSPPPPFSLPPTLSKTPLTMQSAFRNSIRAAVSLPVVRNARRARTTTAMGQLGKGRKAKTHPRGISRNTISCPHQHSLEPLRARHSIARWGTLSLVWSRTDNACQLSIAPRARGAAPSSPTPQPPSPFTDTHIRPAPALRPAPTPPPSLVRSIRPLDCWT